MTLINLFIIILILLLYYIIHYIFDVNITKNIVNKKNKILIKKAKEKLKNDNIYISLNKSSTHSNSINPANFN